MKKQITCITAFVLLATCQIFAQAKIKETGAMGQKKFGEAAKRVYLAEMRVNYQLLFSQSEVA